MTVEYLLDTGVLNAYLRGYVGAVALVDRWVMSGHASTSDLAVRRDRRVLAGTARGWRQLTLP